jgi:hypothetical protein
LTNLSCCSQAYQERSRYISDQLSALKTQMDDLKMEDRMTRNDLLHEELIRLGNNKRLALDKVDCSVRECHGFESYQGKLFFPWKKRVVLIVVELFTLSLHFGLVDVYMHVSVSHTLHCVVLV